MGTVGSHQEALGGELGGREGELALTLSLLLRGEVQPCDVRKGEATGGTEDVERVHLYMYMHVNVHVFTCTCGCKVKKGCLWFGHLQKAL